MIFTIENIHRQAAPVRQGVLPCGGWRLVSLEETEIFGEDSYVMVAPLAIDNMKVVIVAPHSDYSGPIDHAIFNDIKAISDEIQEMAAENERMYDASIKINDTCGKSSEEAQSVSAATEEQTASTHEIADASRSLAKLAGDLQAEINKFRL